MFSTLFKRLPLVFGFSAALLLALTTKAQLPPNSPSGPPGGPPNRLTPAELSAETEDEVLDQLVLVDESALMVFELLEQMTGKIILRRQDIAPIKINFNSNGPISQGEAVLALESLLTLNNIMLTDLGGRFMKAVPASDVNRHVPEMIVGSTLDLPPSQQIYAKLFQFDYLIAEQAAGLFIAPLLSQQSSFVNFPKSNAVLITDALVNLQRIETIIGETDKPQKVRENIEFVKLNYVQATQFQERIERLIQGPLRNYLEGSTSVTADERTNQLIIISHPENMDIINKLIASVDIDAAPLTSSEVFPLRQAKAEEVVPIIEEIITGQREGREEDAEVNRENNPGNGNANGVPPQGAPNVPPVPQPSSGSSDSSGSLQFSSFVGLSADERTNSIVAYGTHSDLKTLGELIEKIDIPLPQVLIEAVITEVSLSETQASGLSSFGFDFDGSTNIISDISGTVAGGLALSNGIIDLGSPRDLSLSVAVQSLNNDSNARILSSPRIIVSHNEEGSINVSNSQPIITSSTSSLDNNSNTRSTVEFRDIGIQLNVEPLIGVDGTVQLVVEQIVENVVGSIDIDGNTQPIIGVREATSTVNVQDGQVIVLGGLQQNSINDGNSYLPIIGRLPGIKNLFGSDTAEYVKTELIIFIRPTVLVNPAIAKGMTEETISKASEEPAIQNYLDNNTMGGTYLEGSIFEEKPAKKNKKQEEALPEVILHDLPLIPIEDVFPEPEEVPIPEQEVAKIEEVTPLSSAQPSSSRLFNSRLTRN